MSRRYEDYDRDELWDAKRDFKEMLAEAKDELERYKATVAKFWTSEDYTSMRAQVDHLWDCVHEVEQEFQIRREEASERRAQREYEREQRERQRAERDRERQDQRERQRERSAKRETGLVRFWNEAKGYGFITPEGGGDDVFVHASRLVSDSLACGQKVLYECRSTSKGAQAFNIDLVEDSSADAKSKAATGTQPEATSVQPKAAAADSQPVSPQRFGIVRWFSARKGFGYIVPDEGSGDVFVHRSNIVAEGVHELLEGERVAFSLSQGAKGPRALDVHRG